MSFRGPQSPNRLVGHTLGHYRIIEQIGAGGMGVVYRAHDEQLERDVAVKVLPVGTLEDEAARKRFRKEALALAKLNHPNIATIFEFSSQNSTDYLVTEYISGQTLDEKLATSALSEKEVAGLGIQLAQGLSAAHEHGIVHRDLKPANLRLTPDKRLKILDFGLAQLMPRGSEVGLTATLTQSQAVSGTLPYMSPEQLRGGMADARTDIWAAGAVLYEMATAHRPFEEKVPTALADDIIHKTPLSPRSLKSPLSPKLAAVILKCLEKEPAQRYQSARELQTDLERLSTGASPLAAQRQLWPVIAASAIVVLMLAVGAFFYLHRSPKLTYKDTIVLSDFDNKTGDPVFDDTLKQGLAVQLEQSPFLNVLPDEKVNATLGLMNRSPNERLTENVARDLCQRAGSKAMLAGSIDSLGSQYVIGLKALNCTNGDLLAREQVQAAAKEEVLKALSTAARSVRGKLGEALATIQKFDIPVEQATTSSLEALKAYSLGQKTWNMKGDTAALPLFKRALELDPQFAMAYARLGSAYRNLDEPTLAVENMRKAFALREKVSERERLYIEVRYYRWVTGEFEKWAQVCELWKQTYPRDRVPYNDLGHVYSAFGQYDKSVEEAREALRLEPNTGANYSNLALYYLSLNRLDEAEAVLKKAEERKLESRDLLWSRYQLAFVKGDEGEMKRLVEQAVGKPRIEDLLLYLQGGTETYHGRLAKARELRRRAADLAKDNDATETAAGYLAEAGLEEAYSGETKPAHTDADEALRLASNRAVQGYSALALALVGDTTRAEKLTDELNKSFPLDTRVQRYWLPTIRAVLALEGKKADKAIDALQVTIPYELAPFGGWNGCLCPAYARGQAYLMLHNSSAAAAEFQKIVDHRGIVMNFPLGALAHLGLARAYVFSGDTVKAKSAYQDFFTLWKDADPDIPILKEAKAEYAKLQ